MPKKLSKKGSKKRTPAAETALVPRAGSGRAPNLADLVERARRGSMKLSDVNHYVEAGGSPNVLLPMDKVGMVPLLFGIAMSRQSEAAASIELLLQAGTKVDAIADAAGLRTALMVASSLSNNLHAVEALLHGGADPCLQPRTDGMSALHFATAKGYSDICSALHTASAGGALELVGKAEDVCATPLIAACSMDECAVVELLLALGANVNNSSTTGNTPLIVAAQKGKGTVVMKLLLQQDGIAVNHRNDGGDTALMIAIQVGNVAAVKALLQSGADACNVNNLGFSPMFVAVAEGHLSVLKLLTQHGADVTATTQSAYTLLMQTARSNQPHVAEFLINKGVSVHAVDEIDNTALQYAALGASTETARVLLAHGADVNACDPNLFIPLHDAALIGQPQEVEVLIAAGADVLRCDGIGSTALHTAIYSNHLTAVKLLLEHGAAVVLNTMRCYTCTCCGHVSALMMCKDTAILKLLLTVGGDVHAVTSNGDTCLHIAARHSYPIPVLCLLIKAGADMNAVNNRGKTAAGLAHDAGNTLIEQLLNRAAQQEA
jgi:ankyrin repeat protein